MLRDRPDFAELLRAAASDLRVPPALVEKDYWLTQVLRVLARRHYGQFVLKGGTSLAKGYVLLQRFSEDVDILLVPHQSDRQDGAVESLLECVKESLAADLPGPLGEGTAEEGVARVLTFSYPSGQSRAPGLDPFVRVDYGVGGGSIPQEEVRISTLVGDRLRSAGQDPDVFDDLAEFRIPVLHPARTLIEKLCIVHGMADRIIDGNPHVRSREARHYYDLWHLLDEDRSPALNWIDRRGNIDPLVDDCLRMTRSHYGFEPSIPATGIATGPAFSDPAVLSRVAVAYERMLEVLAFPGREHPTFDAVLHRVHEHAARIQAPTG